MSDYEATKIINTAVRSPHGEASDAVDLIKQKKNKTEKKEEQTTRNKEIQKRRNETNKNKSAEKLKSADWSLRE